MGEPSTSHVVLPAPEFIGCVEGTPGSETSQYRQEEKTRVIPLVVASESGLRLNRARVIPGRGCVFGVVGRLWTGLPAGRAVIKPGASRSRWKAAP